MTQLCDIRPGSPPLVTLLAAEMSSQLVAVLGRTQVANMPVSAAAQPSGFYDADKADAVIRKAFMDVTDVEFDESSPTHRKLLQTARRYAVLAGMAFGDVQLLQRLWHSSILLQPSITVDNQQEPAARCRDTPWRSSKPMPTWARHAFHWCVLHPDDVVHMQSKHPAHAREWTARLRGDHVEFTLVRDRPAVCEVYISQDCINLLHVRTN